MLKACFTHQSPEPQLPGTLELLSHFFKIALSRCDVLAGVTPYIYVSRLSSLGRGLEKAPPADHLSLSTGAWLKVLLLVGVV